MIYVGNIIYKEGVELIPAVLAAKSYTEVAVKVTGFLELITDTISGIKVIAKLCLPPAMTYIAECIKLGGQIYVFISTGGIWHGAAITL